MRPNNSTDFENLKFGAFISDNSLGLPYRGEKTGHKINRVKLLVGGNFSHFHMKLGTFPKLNFRF